MLTRLVARFGFDGDNVPLNNTIEFAAQCLDSSNNEVRQAASDLVLEAYKHIGIDSVEPLLTSSLRSLQDSASTCPPTARRPKTPRSHKLIQF